ncbi:MAG: maltose O-acetyltransferase [Alteromonadaceae bacterium]|jgi:maltose O-acetyltransferase
MKQLYKIFITFLVFLKYRKLIFKYVGHNTSYRSLKSNFSYSQNISFGNDVRIGPGADLDGAGNIIIGNGVIFAPNVCVYSRSHYFDGVDLQALPFDNKIITDEVIINDYVWVGRNVIILPGVNIGEGAVIGAGAVVSKNIPRLAVAVGNPAKVIKYRDAINYENLKSSSNFVYRKFGHAKVLINKHDL